MFNFGVVRLGIACFALGISLQCGSASAQSASVQPDLDGPREKVAASPQDGKARYEYAKALRLNGKPAEAASQLLEATSVDPTLYVAYHELSLVKARPDQLDEGIERLNMLKSERPKDLMLRVALSELFEQRGNNYQAAKTLIDLVFQNAVPPKYVNKVQSRIHYLLSKAKDVHTIEKTTTEESEDDTLAPPLPESSLRRNLSATKLKDAKTQGFGHASVIP